MPTEEGSAQHMFTQMSDYVKVSAVYHVEALCRCYGYGSTSGHRRTGTASHQGLAMLVDEVLGGLGPFGKNNIVHSFLGDLQATQIKV